MIPKAYITAWRAVAPWSADVMVEQDLVISRALVELFRVPEIALRLAFRGGTALHKLYLHPPARYSEDIDLVQVQPEAIGDTLDRVRSVLDPWLGFPRRQSKAGSVTLGYRFASEDAPPLSRKLKIEINTREHVAHLGLVRLPFRIENGWFSGHAEVTTFALDELLSTKLRALYQRKKGRDLFDLAFSLERGGVNAGVLLECFAQYMSAGGHAVSRAQFEANLHNKSSDRAFRGDIAPLLRPGIPWDFNRALRTVSDQLIARLPGEAWKGESSP